MKFTKEQINLIKSEWNIALNVIIVSHIPFVKIQASQNATNFVLEISHNEGSSSSIHPTPKGDRACFEFKLVPPWLYREPTIWDVVAKLEKSCQDYAFKRFFIDREEETIETWEGDEPANQSWHEFLGWPKEVEK